MFFIEMKNNEAIEAARELLADYEVRVLESRLRKCLLFVISGGKDYRLAEMAFMANWHQKPIRHSCGHCCARSCGHLTFINPIQGAF
jgi:hypothetical protein